MKKLLAFLLALVMVLSLFAACGKKEKTKTKEKEEDSIAGKYMLASVRIDGEEIDEEQLRTEFGEDSYIRLSEDGTAVMKVDGETKDMAYEDDEIWNAENEDEVFGFSIKKDSVIITVEEDGEMELIFEKSSDDDDEDEDDEDETEETETVEETEETETTEETMEITEATEETVDPNVRVYTVHVVDEEGNPMPNVMINFCDENGCMPAFTDEEGVAEATVVNDKYAYIGEMPEGYEYATSQDKWTFEVNNEVTIVLQKN